MKEKIILGVKGFFIGIANLIPGVSGGTLAVNFGIYEKLISAISHFFKNLKQNLKFIIPIGIGAVLSILFGSKLIKTCLNDYTLATTLFFAGLVIGGIPLIHKKIKKDYSVKNILICLLTFSFVIALALLNAKHDADLNSIGVLEFIKLMSVGVVAAATMVIPGISGSLLLMTLGYFEPIINCLNDITDFSMLSHNLSILLPFGIGAIFGLIFISKLIEYLFKKFEIKTLFAVMGFILASSIGMFISISGDESLNLVFSVPQVLIGLVLLIVGFLISYKLGD